jgi:hypothetical protein
MIMRIIAFAVALSLAAPLCAADAVSAKKKSRSLKEVIELALREGKDNTLNATAAQAFGFGQQDMPSKKLRYKQSATPDKHEHTFNVVSKRDAKGNLVPVALEISRGTGKKIGDVVHIDALVFRANLDGKLQNAYRSQGAIGVAPQSLGKSADLNRQLKEELDFHQKKVVELGLDFAR